MQFFRQFQDVGYAASPNGEFRQQYFAWIIADFVKHTAEYKRDPPVEFQLSEGDYIKLADFSTFATCTNIARFLGGIFREIIRDNSVVIIDLETMIDKMPLKLGVPHICDYDTRSVEDRYSLACGKGAIVRPKQAVQPAELNTNVTGFTPDAANLETASEMLSAQSKKKKQRTAK
jgi:hypothetical protein